MLAISVPTLCLKTHPYSFWSTLSLLLLLWGPLSGPFLSWIIVLEILILLTAQMIQHHTVL